MKYLGAILATVITVAIILTIGLANYALLADAGPSVSAEEVATPVQESAPVADAAAIQAAYAARETLLQAQIVDLDAGLANRQADYEARVEELNGLLLTGEGQLAQLQDQETALKEQIDQLLVAQADRTANYESQRQQAYTQYQINIQQLQTQLDEGNSKLSEALARLGQ